MAVKLWTQEMMDLDSVKQEHAKTGYRSLAGLLADPTMDENRKYWIAWQVAHFETLNGVTKADLQAMLRFVMEEFFEEVREPEPDSRFKILKRKR